MRILVISDTHKRIGKVIDLIQSDSKFDHICHLGDHTSDAQDIESICEIPVTYVKGNCDFYDISSRNEEMIKIGGYRILLTHGHLYSVKSGTELLRKILDEQRANIVLFGHTHHAVIEYFENGTIFNPGSISLPRDGAPSYGIIEIDHNSRVTFEIVRTE